MKTIEKYIKQEKAFKSERSKVLVNVIYTGHHIMNQLDSFFKEFDLTNKQYNVLRILNGSKKPVSTCYIKERMLVKNADASRIVDRLRDKALLNKSVSLEDKRLISIGLTNKGKALLSIIEDRMNEIDQVTSSLTIQECKSLNHLLDKLKLLT